MKRIRVVVLTVWLCLALVSCGGAETDALLKIHFLDVGQGDCILLRTPDGDILIDAGTEESQEMLCLRLDRLGVEELLLAVFTHTDEDHIGGADGVLSMIPTREVWVNGSASDNESAQMLFRTVEKNDIELRAVCAGEIRRIGDVVLSVFFPFDSDAASGNENSIVLKVHCKNFDMVLTGDAGSEQEQMLIEQYGTAQLDCDIYKVGHHGSNTSSSAAFLSAMTPQYAVISCGAGNSYGHPMGEVLARLEESGAVVLRTDLDGEIVFETNGSELRYRDASLVLQ